MIEIIKYPHFELENHNVNRNDTCFFKSFEMMLSPKRIVQTEFKVKKLTKKKKNKTF